MSLRTLLYWEWHLIPRWYLRSIFARFPEQLLKDLVSCRSPGMGSMIYRFLWDAFGVLSCPFWSTALQYGARLIGEVSGARFLTGGVFKCDIVHHRSVAILCMLYKIRCNPVHCHNGALPGCQWRLHAVLWSHIGTLMRLLAVEPRSTAGLLFPSQCPSGTISLTPYLMVWDWRVSRDGTMFFYFPKLLYPYCSLLLFFTFSSFCIQVGIVGLGSSDWYIPLSQPCTADLF